MIYHNVKYYPDSTTHAANRAEYRVPDNCALTLPKEHDHSLMDCRRGWRVSNTLVTRVEADITSLLEG